MYKNLCHPKSGEVNRGRCNFTKDGSGMERLGWVKLIKVSWKFFSFSVALLCCRCGKRIFQAWRGCDGRCMTTTSLLQRTPCERHVCTIMSVLIQCSFNLPQPPYAAKPKWWDNSCREIPIALKNLNVAWVPMSSYFICLMYPHQPYHPKHFVPPRDVLVNRCCWR